jgi:hypothetical protein
LSLSKWQTADRSFRMMQDSWASVLDPVISIPLNHGIILENVGLSSGFNAVNHKLSRDLQGWFIVRQRGPASIYDLQNGNPMPNKTLSLQSSASVSVDLFVF